MDSLRFQLELAWSQISIFDANLIDPFNDWNEHHLRQGFSWRSGSVSFRLPVKSGKVDVDVALVEGFVVDSAAQYAVVVPFVTWAGVIEISSITESELIEVDSGSYSLLFQTGVDPSGKAWVHLSLMAVGRQTVEPVVLRSDDEFVQPHLPLLMEAEPAA